MGNTSEIKQNFTNDHLVKNSRTTTSYDAETINKTGKIRRIWGLNSQLDKIGLKKEGKYGAKKTRLEWQRRPCLTLRNGDEERLTRK